MLLAFLVIATTTLAATIPKRAPAGVPQFAIDYAPVAYLHSVDAYRPSDIGTQLVNSQPEINYTVVSDAPSPLTLDNLNELNDFGDEVYLTSKDDVESNPTWLFGVTPDSSGKTDGAVSSTVVVNDHGSGLVDVFYFYFFAFDFGGIYFGFNIGNHVGDWEHTMVRFQDEVPQAIWYSQHNNGQAFEYDVVEKYEEQRPVVYVANGTHANYAIEGTHDHTIPNVNLPNGPVQDYTDKGPFWDPIQSAYFYSYDASSQQFTPYDDNTPVNWLYYLGKWGDEQYPDDDPRQESILGIDGLYKYTSGPTGPIDKQLNRTDVCPDNGNLCIVRTILVP